MGKRIFLFILTNVLVIATITIIMTVFNVGSYITADGKLEYGTLFIFSAIVGFSGAFISLLMSRWMAKKMMNVKVLKPDGNLSPREQSIVEKVHRFSRTAGLTKMPEVGIYQSPEVNAFATGPSKKRSLVAVSSGLLDHMDEDSVEGVIAHEVAHVANGDMVTMTLLQGVVNTFVVFFSRIIAFVATSFIKDDGMRMIVHFIAIIVFQIAFSILGSIVVLAYSRYREFHADAGGADFAGKDKMIHALQSLNNYKNMVDTSQSSLQTLKINNKKKAMLFSSHPALDDRIRALQNR